MYIDNVFLGDAFDDFAFDAADFQMGFRDLHGQYSIGRNEDDPDMCEYEELVELGMSLNGQGQEDSDWH